jgi:hypothetical protein
MSQQRRRFKQIQLLNNALSRAGLREQARPLNPAFA